MNKPNNYRWEQCYELAEGEVLWAIVDDVSHSEGLITSHLLVVNHEWADSFGVPFPECPLPKRIVSLLNEDDSNILEILRLRAALQEINAVLRVPGAGYVPAIGDAFDIIDKVLANE